MHPTHNIRGTCIIMGASIAGILAARALSTHFEKILIIERDRLPEAPECRKGTAQGHHAHILLRRGLLGLEQMFPGYTLNLLDAGAVMTNASRDWYNLFPMGAFPNFESDYEFICASRPLIEHTLRHTLLQQCGNITITDQSNVTRISLSQDQPAQITVQNKDASKADMTADLLVDASGRNSHTPNLLQQQGFGTVPETLVKPWLGYATRLYSSVSMPTSVKATVVMAKDPDMTRGGVLFPIENNQYICTLYGFSSDYPATDEMGFMHYASSLRSDVIYSAIKPAQPLTDAKAFIKDESRYRHYATQQNWPQGFLVIGDAVCSFNPIYGQGITASVLAAEALKKFVTHNMSAEANWARRAQRKIVQSYRAAWTISTSEDLRWPKTEGAKSGILLGIMHRFSNWIGKAACADQHIAFAYIKVLHMTATPLALLTPVVLLRMLMSVFRKKT